MQSKQTRFYQQVHGEGKEEGKQEGRIEGEVALLERLLRRRFGPLSRHSAPPYPRP
jgi:predicted transposase YdaD